jgi:hypothetical protein
MGIGLLSLTLTGCFVHLPKYPPAWSGLRSADTRMCVDLTGTYANAGESAERLGAPLSLTQILFPRNKGIDSAATVDIESATTALVAVVTLPEGTTRRSVLRETAKCSPRERYFEDPNDRGGVDGDGIVGVVHTSLELFRGEDGSLVVRTTERDLVIALLIPVGTDVKYWIRFAQKAPTSP